MVYGAIITTGTRVYGANASAKIGIGKFDWLPIMSSAPIISITTQCVSRLGSIDCLIFFTSPTRTTIPRKIHTYLAGHRQRNRHIIINIYCYLIQRYSRPVWRIILDTQNKIAIVKIARRPSFVPKISSAVTGWRS